jgi:hypothetical protein
MTYFRLLSSSFFVATIANSAFAQPVELRGRVDVNMSTAVRAGLDAGQRDFTINSSNGGFVTIAAIIADTLNSHNASLTVNGQCLSACALLAIGVSDKRYASGADIEIHGARYAHPQNGQDDDAPARSAALYMRLHGVPERIALGPGMGINLHRLSPLELSQIGFVPV